MFNAITQNLFHGASYSAVGSFLSVSNGSLGTSPSSSSPQDLRTIFKKFDLDPKVTRYACCTLPTCSAIYPPTFDALHKTFSYPLRCQQAKFGKVCGSHLVEKSLVMNGQSIPRPIKQYPYRHFHDHVGSMLSRPGIEQAIQSHVYSTTYIQEITDIMSSPALRNLIGVDGRPFLQTHGTDLNLVWSLCVDWYNPRQNKAAGKSVSTGVISMICLSLPQHLRTREENIHVSGVIPGPSEPSLDAVNHFLEPLIDELKESYEDGIYYSRTYDYPSGRSSRSAIVPVICDTMASKKVTGHCGHRGKYFCSRCRLPRNQLQENFDANAWPPGLTREDHVALADAWRNMETLSAQISAVKRHGIRWSVLLKLPYWQPSQWTITEGMHVLLLGVIPRHCRDLLGLNMKELPSRDIDEDDEGPHDASMKRGRKALQTQSFQKLKKLKMRVLKALCLEMGVVLPAPKGRRTKLEYVNGLLVSQYPCFLLTFLFSSLST